MFLQVEYGGRRRELEGDVTVDEAAKRHKIAGFGDEVGGGRHKARNMGSF